MRCFFWDGNDYARLLKSPESIVAGEIKAFDWKSIPSEHSRIGQRRFKVSSPLCSDADAYVPRMDLTCSRSTATHTGQSLGAAPDGHRKPFPELWESLWADISQLVHEALAGRNTRVVNMRLDLSRRRSGRELLDVLLLASF